MRVCACVYVCVRVGCVSLLGVWLGVKRKLFLLGNVYIRKFVYSRASVFIEREIQTIMCSRASVQACVVMPIKTVGIGVPR